MARNQHVTPHPKGGWQVKAAGAKKATVVTTTQRKAIEIATQIAKNQGSEMITHNKQGRIRERNSYGNDPYPPKG